MFTPYTRFFALIAAILAAILASVLVTWAFLPAKTKPSGLHSSGSQDLICRAHRRLLGVAPISAPYQFETLFEALGLDPSLEGVFSPPDVSAAQGGPGWTAARSLVTQAWLEGPAQVLGQLGGESPGYYSRGSNGGGESNHAGEGEGEGEGEDEGSAADARPAWTRTAAHRRRIAKARSHAYRALIDDNARVLYLRQLFPEMQRRRAAAEKEEAKKLGLRKIGEAGTQDPRVVAASRHVMLMVMNEFCAS